MEHKFVLKYFADIIKKEVGIVYEEQNYYQLENRLSALAKSEKLKDIEELFNMAKTGLPIKIFENLLDLSTNNETSFFRDGKVFLAIEEIISDLISKKNQVRLWSAASSTGQEAVTLSLICQEIMTKQKNSFIYEVIGTDISKKVLLRSQEGVYNEIEVSRGLDSILLKKYFDKVQNGWKTRSDISSSIKFHHLNLLDEVPTQDLFDVVLCRNVLIYQDVEGKKKILGNVTRNLRPGGVLILGSGESLVGLSSEYEQKICNGAVIYTKNIK